MNHSHHCLALSVSDMGCGNSSATNQEAYQPISTHISSIDDQWRNAVQSQDVEAMHHLLTENAHALDLCLDVGHGLTPLHVACKHGHAGVVTLLLRDNRVNPNQASDDGCGPFHIACQENHEDAVRVDPNQAYNNGLTALYVACREGHEGIVTLILGDKRLNPNQADKNGATPLYVACLKGHVGVVALMLGDEHVDPNQADSDGYTPLYIACQDGFETIVTLMLGNDRVDPNQAGSDGFTPFCIACQEGHERIVELMLGSERVNPNQAKNDGTTPLSVACEFGHEEVVILMLGNERVDPNQANNKGFTPFSMACGYGYEDVVRLMLRNKRVHLNQSNDDGFTPLAIACRKDHGGVVSLMLNNERVVPNQANNTGATPFYIACQCGREGVVSLMLRHNHVNPNQVDNAGVTPFCLAGQEGHTGVVTLMLGNERVDPNQPDSNGFTPLYVACEKGLEGYVSQMLSNERIDPNRAAGNGFTPLCIACERGHERIVTQMLGNKRVDINQGANNGDTPLMKAVAGGSCETALALIMASCSTLAVNGDGWHCLHHAAWEARAGVDMCELLLAHVLELLEVPAEASGATPLGLAVKKGCAGKVKVLLDHNADPNQFSGDYTPLYYAIHLHKIDAAQALLEAGADPTLVRITTAPLRLRPLLDPMYLSVLDAARSGLDEVQQCIEDGYEVDCQDEFGCTPLIEAILQSSAAKVRTLLDYGADGELGTRWGCTPMMWAHWMCLPEVVTLLTSKGIRLLHEGKVQLDNLCIASAVDPIARSILTLRGSGGDLYRGRRPANSFERRMADGAAVTIPQSHEVTGMGRPTQSLEAFVMGLAEQPFAQELWKTEDVDSTLQTLQDLLMMAKFFTTNVVAAGSGQLHAQLIMAICLYTTETPTFSFYAECNAALRSGKPEAIAQWHPFIYVLQDALKRIQLTSSRLLYRGVSKKLSGYEPGKTIEWSAFSSASAEYDMAVNFFGTEGMLFIIRGHSAKPIALYSAFPEEKEWLYPPSSKFRVLGIAPYHPGLPPAAKLAFENLDLRKAGGARCCDMAWISEEDMPKYSAFVVYMEQLNDADAVVTRQTTS